MAQTVYLVADVVNRHLKCSIHPEEPFNHSEPPTTALKRVLQAKLTLQVVHLTKGSLDMITMREFYSIGPSKVAETLPRDARC